MPHVCHRACAVTGALATACAVPGSVAHALVGETPPAAVQIDHPSGQLELALSWAEGAEAPIVSVVRTARRLFEGGVFARVAQVAA